MRLQKSNSIKINNENVLKDIYKYSEDGAKTLAIKTLIYKEKYRKPLLLSVLKRLEKNSQVDLVRGFVILNDSGRLAARQVVRKHRLWEIYLSKYFKLDPDHLHDDAEGIEHVITPEIERELIELLEHPDKDPHQSEIPY
jgi:manganese/zinc/iron transport system permease protein